MCVCGGGGGGGGWGGGGVGAGAGVGQVRHQHHTESRSIFSLDAAHILSFVIILDVIIPKGLCAKHAYR